jgi:hypothetical protein
MDGQQKQNAAHFASLMELATPGSALDRLLILKDKMIYKIAKSVSRCKQHP